MAAAYASRLRSAEIHFALEGLFEPGYLVSDKLSEAALALAQQSGYFSKPTTDAVWTLVTIGVYISDKSISDERGISLWTTVVSHMSSPSLAGRIDLRETLQTLVRLSIGCLMSKRPQFLYVFPPYQCVHFCKGLIGS